jgi:glycerate 2-kinase
MSRGDAPHSRCDQGVGNCENASHLPRELWIRLMIIRNWDELTSKGNVQGREIVLKIIEHALEDVNSFYLVKKNVKVNNELTIGPLKYDLTRIDDIFVVGGGKQVTFVASALEEILGQRISEGVVVEKKGWGCKTRAIRVVEGGHPIPDNGSVEGAEEIVRIVKKAKENDLVIVCVTGGCTSLTMLPVEGITLEDTRIVSQLMLETGAPIEDMNTVRKHLSQVAGGKLAMLTDAELVSLIAVDEVAGVPWGPTVPDTTSFSDAKHVLIRYDLWAKVPDSVRDLFERADMLQETPKAIDFERTRIKAQHSVFAENKILCRAAERKSTELGLAGATISTSIEGEAKDVGIVLASIAREIERNGKPFNPPCVLVAGGETTVTLRHAHGEGGRNQELTLAAALKIAGSKKITVASIGTDGTDGPTDIAGAIVDGYTLERSEELRVNMLEGLEKHDSSNVFRKLGDAVYTSNTGTNLMDLIVIFVSNCTEDGHQTSALEKLNNCETKEQHTLNVM